MRGSGLEVIGARDDSARRAGSAGFVEMEWDNWPFAEDPYVAVKQPEDAERTYTTTVNGSPCTGTADEYYRATGSYIFAPEDPVSIAVPSGLTTEDFPELEDAFGEGNIKVVEGEYWLTPEDINVYTQIAELREDPSLDFAEILRVGAYPNHPAPIGMRGEIQAEALALSGEDPYKGYPVDQLWITAVLAEAPTKEHYARLAAKYLGRNITILDVEGTKRGHIDYRNGNFVEDPSYVPPNPTRKSRLSP